MVHDPSKPYLLFTKASKYTLLTKSNACKEDKAKTIQHLITYVSGLFQGSQLNWLVTEKEAYAIYKAMKKLIFYPEDAQIKVHSDHLPLHMNMLHGQVNNWAIVSPVNVALFQKWYRYSGCV